MDAYASMNTVAQWATYGNTQRSNWRQLRFQESFHSTMEPNAPIIRKAMSIEESLAGRVVLLAFKPFPCVLRLGMEVRACESCVSADFLKRLKNPPRPGPKNSCNRPIGFPHTNRAHILMREPRDISKAGLVLRLMKGPRCWAEDIDCSRTATTAHGLLEELHVTEKQLGFFWQGLEKGGPFCPSPWCYTAFGGRLPIKPFRRVLGVREGFHPSGASGAWSDT